MLLLEPCATQASSKNAFDAVLNHAQSNVVQAKEVALAHQANLARLDELIGQAAQTLGASANDLIEGFNARERGRRPVPLIDPLDEIVSPPPSPERAAELRGVLQGLLDTKFDACAQILVVDRLVNDCERQLAKVRSVLASIQQAGGDSPPSAPR